MSRAILSTATIPNMKREAIVEAAKQLFLKEGYGASMDAVAIEAGVSKQTVYKHFGSKEALFVAVVETLSGELLGSLDGSDRLLSSPRAGLVAFGLRYIEFRLMPSSIALHRIVVAEASRFPELAAEIFSFGPARTIGHLAAALREADRRGTLRVPDPSLAAENFLGAINGQRQLRALLAVGAETRGAELRRAVEHAVDMLLALHSPTVERAEA
jgi:AcrR family transcriptional regulator